MEGTTLQKIMTTCLQENKIDPTSLFAKRFLINANAINHLFQGIYGTVPDYTKKLEALVLTIIQAYQNRDPHLQERDVEKEEKGHWFLSNDIMGMSLYVDRFCGDLKTMPSKLNYLQDLGINFLHLMPLFESPAGESDGGYAVSDFRKIESRFGTIEDLIILQKTMQEQGMYLMLDIVLNHTSHHHEWAKKAKEGDPYYQDFFYVYDDEKIPNQFNQYMPEIFPESSPGSFTYDKEMKKWVMTVFHTYQWDLNFTNPNVFIAMLDTIFFYANIGVDILRIDAPAFIWKQLGTTCQNLPQAHTLLRLIKLCVQVATPGMALLGEAIVAPKEIMKYFGTDNFTAKECDVAYAATNMALQWDALATGDTKVMLAAQQEILKKPFGTTWISYTRCHDDIGLGYDDEMIASANYTPYDHRKFIKEFYSGTHPYSTATGALFSVNPKTQDARISGTLASLCGLEKAIESKNKNTIELAINKIILMQAQTLFIGGIPMLFYGDEVGYTNDYSYLKEEGKSYDNRWMHRPIIDWKKNELYKKKNSVEAKIFKATQQLIALRKQLEVVADYNNIKWLTPHNTHVAGFMRSLNGKKLFCLFNYSNAAAYITWYIFKEQGVTGKLYNHYTKETLTLGHDNEYLVLKAYEFCIIEAIC
jgi:amylosucrase